MTNKITVFNALNTIKELTQGQEELVKAVEEIATTVAINNCTTRLEELKKAESMREEVLQYLSEAGAEKDYISIPIDTLKEWKMFLEGPCKGKNCKVSGAIRFGKVKLYNENRGYSVYWI